MSYFVELLHIPCLTVKPLLVKMLDILCTNIRLSIMIFLIYLTELIIIFKMLHLDDICLAGALREYCNTIPADDSLCY